MTLPNRPTTTTEPPLRSLCVFWVGLLTSAGLFAVVALLPGMVRASRLDAEFAARQARLVELQRETRSLRRLVEVDHRPILQAVPIAGRSRTSAPVETITLPALPRRTVAVPPRMFPASTTRAVLPSSAGWRRQCWRVAAFVAPRRSELLAASGLIALLIFGALSPQRRPAAVTLRSCFRSLIPRRYRKAG